VSYSALKLWRIKKERGELIKIITCPTLYSISSRLTILSNGNVACSFCDGSIQIWNVERNEMVQRLSHHTSAVSGLIQLSNGHLASSSDDSTVKVWNVENNGQLLNTFSLGRLANSRFCFITLPKELFTAVKKETPLVISIFDSNTGDLVKSLNDHESEVFSLVLLDDSHIASSSEDGTIKIWNSVTGQAARRLDTSDPCVILLFPFGDGLLASHHYIREEAVTNSTIHLWNWQTGERTKTIELEESKLSSLVRLKKSAENLTIGLDWTGSVKFLNI
jgi:WD40 repeat protein